MTRSLGLTGRASAAVLSALIPGGRCNGLETTWPCSLLAAGPADEQRGQWEAVHLDLAADLDVPSSPLTWKRFSANLRITRLIHITAGTLASYP